MKRKLFNAALFAAVLVAAPVSTFVSCADYDSDIENLQNQKNDLEALLLQKEQVLNDKIAALEAENDALEAAYKAADAALTQALADNKTELLGEIATCKAECKTAMDKLKTLIDGLRTDLDALKEQHDKDVETLLAADDTLQKNIDAANTAIENLETRLNARIEALETLTSTHTTEIANLKSTLEDVVKDIKKVREEFAAADAALDKKFQGKIDDLWKQVNDNKDAIENEVTARENAIKELTKVVNDNKKACDDAVKELQDKDTELAGLIQTLTNDFNAYKDFNDAEVKDLKDRMDAVEGQVSVNTKAILDLAARVVDLNSGLDQLKASLEAAKLAQKLVDDAQDALIDKLITEKANLTYVNEQVDILNAKIGKVAGDLAELTKVVNQHTVDIETLKSKLSALQQEVTEAKRKYDEEIAALKKADTQINEKIDQVKLELQGNIDAVEEAYKAADEEIWEKLGKLDEAIANLSELVEQYAKELSAEVKGFVLVPDNYYEGIQAIEGDVYKYHLWNVNTELPTFNQKDYLEFCPEVVANYNVNPSTATLSKDTQYYSYTVEDRVNRGNNETLQPVIKKVAQDGGLLTVHMSITDPTKNQTPSNLVEQAFSDKVTVMALQYENPAAKDSAQVVTSDYAVLYLEELIGVNLRYKLCATQHIPDFNIHAIDFGKKKIYDQPKPNYINYKDTLDIQNYITTQFGTKDPSTTLPEGFSYRYSVAVGDKTNFHGNDTKYFNAEKLEKGVIDPQLPNGNEATIACIGKWLRVRVDVMRGEDVAEVGYLDFAIVGDAVVDFADAATTTDNYYVSCDESEYALNAELEADNVWKKIQEVTGVEDLDELKKEYSFVEENGVLTQYSKGRESLSQGGIGTIVLNDDGSLTWTITYADLDGTVPPLTTYVLVRSENLFNTNGKFNEFYLPLVWEPAETEVWGGETGVESVLWKYQKVENQWQNGEIRLYADLTVKGNAPFVYDLSKAIKGITVELEKTFKNAKDIELTDGHYRFVDNPVEAARTQVGVSGATYTLKVNADGSALEAYATEVAASEATAEANGVQIATISREGKVELQNNYVTKDILNKYEKSDLTLGHTLAAHVSYEVSACAGAVEVTTNDFDVRFLKPVTVKENVINITDTDGDAGTITIDLGQNIINFNDKSFAEHPEYYGVYDLRLKTDLRKWTTNYNGGTLGETLLSESDVYNDFGVEGEDNALPYITYKNNTAVVGKYTVRVPFTLEYVWGNTQTYYVDILVQKTQGNSNRK